MFATNVMGAPRQDPLMAERDRPPSAEAGPPHGVESGEADLQTWLPDQNDDDRGPRLRPIGRVESLDGDPPHPTYWRDIQAILELVPALASGLDGIETFSHAFVLYWLDEADQVVLHHIPPDDEMTLGVFASRCPLRPNAIGLSVVEILGRDGTRLKVRGLDARDGTPVLDIKPYSPRLDAVPDARGIRSVLDERASSDDHDPPSDRDL